MNKVNIARLKAELSKYIKIARAGDDVVVMDRNAPVARLSSYDSDTPVLPFREAEAGHAGLASLAYPPLEPSGIDTMALLTAERGRDR